MLKRKKMNKSVKKKIKDEINVIVTNLALSNNIKLDNININIQKPPKSEVVELRVMKIKIGILEYLIIIDGFFRILKGSFL